MLNLLFFFSADRRFQWSATALLTAVALLSAAGCAKIAEPQPPEIRVPKAAVDLAVRQLSDSVVLTVSEPEQNTDGSPATTFRNVEVFRLIGNANTGGSSQPLPEEQFLKRAAQILSIPSSRFSNYLQNKTFVIQDRPQFPPGITIYAYTFWYAVRFTNNKNQTAGLSNQMSITPIPIPGPPEGISADVTENSIKLKWMAPAENTDGSKPPRIAGYNVYKSEGSEKLSPAPINRDPVQRPEFEDRNFQFDKTYQYAVSTVGSIQNPYAESLPSKTVQVAARDIFSPAPPRDFNAIFESSSVILLWLPSSSADVAGYRLYRQEKGAAAPQLLQSTLISGLSFRDTDVVPGKTYEYSIRAVDTHGNASSAVQTEVEAR
jgi:hypothetical protein